MRISASGLFRGKRSRFLTVLISAAAVTAAAVIVCGVLLFLRERDFAASSERDFVISVISSHREELDGMLTGYINENITGYEDRDTVLKELLGFTPETLSYIRTENSTDSAPEYDICHEDRHILTVTLSRGKSFSGFDSWSVSDISLPADGGPAYPVTVSVPHGAALTVNGKTAASAPEKTAYSALTVFEEGLSDEYCCDSYALGRFFGAPDVAAELDGTWLGPPQGSGGTLSFRYPQSMTEVCGFTVPYGADVTVNGIAPGGDFIAETGIKYRYLTRFEENLTGIPTSVTYQISGLFRTPEISVAYNGTPLEQENGIYRLPDSETKTVTVLAPADATVKINGVAAGKGEITSARAELPILEGVSGYAKDRPYLVEYTVSGLLSDPAVAAVLKGGKPLEADPRESSEGKIVFLPQKTASAPPDRDKVTVKAFAVYYLKYILGGSANANVNFRNVSDMTPAKTPAYNRLRALLPGVRDSAAAKNLKTGTPVYSEYTKYTSSAFSATVTLPYTATVNGSTVEGSITMKILYVFSGNIRRVVNFIVY